MISYTVPLLLVLFVVSASAKSVTTGDNGAARQANSLTPVKRAGETHSNAAADVVRLFIRPEGSTLPPIVTPSAWKHSSSTKDEQKKGGSADEELSGSRRTNEIVRRGSFAGRNRQLEMKTEQTSGKKSSTQLTGSELVRSQRTAAEVNTRFDGSRSSKVRDTTVSETVPESRTEPAQNQRDDGGNNTTRNYPAYDVVDEETTEEMTNVDVMDKNADVPEPIYEDDDYDYDEEEEEGEVEEEVKKEKEKEEHEEEEEEEKEDEEEDNDNDEDYDVDDVNYKDDDDAVQYYDDDAKTVEGQEEEIKEKQLSNKESIGREGIQYQEYEVSADSSRPLDFDNAEVVNEVKVVDRPVRRRRRKGRRRITKKTRSKTRKRRRKRPPIEPVGQVKKPTRTRRPTGTGKRRRKTKGRRRRKGHVGGERRTRRKNRRNKQTTSLGGANRNENKFENNYRRPQVVESTKPRLQKPSIVQNLQQQYHQQQQQDGYAGRYYIPRYVDIHDGLDRRRLVPATADVRGPSSQQATAHRTDQAAVIGRVPPANDRQTANQASQRPQATRLQGHYFDPRQYQQLTQQQQQQQRQYYNHQYQQQRQQHQQQRQHPVHPRQYYQSYYQQQSPPTYSRHQQQIHFIVPTSDIDLGQIQEVMSALGLNPIDGGEQPTSANQAQLQFIGNRYQSSNFGTYREGVPAESDDPAETNQDDEQLETSLSELLASSGDVTKLRQHVRHQRSTRDSDAAERTTDETDEKAADEHGGRDTSEDVVVDAEHVDDEEYIDNSDIEITTRVPGPPTTPLSF